MTTNRLGVFIVDYGSKLNSFAVAAFAGVSGLMCIRKRVFSFSGGLEVYGWALMRGEWKIMTP